MRIWLDPDKLASYRLTVQDVEDALRRQNLEVPAGRIESQQREFSVTARTDLNTVAQFNEVALKVTSGYTVRLRDVARIEQAAANERTSVRLNGVPSISTGIIRNATANPLDVSKGVREVMPQTPARPAAGLKVQVANDNSVFIERSVKSVYATVTEATILVALVVFVFLRTLRASIIPLVTIPVSLIGAFALMALAGFTVNTLTLLALVLAIGLVVDDAIVVVENIFRHIEEGLAPFQAALKGVKEIGFAVVAMTLTLAAVFAPLAFTPGRTGRLFVEFALTLAGAVIVSGFVALTLTPMMCSKLLRHDPKPGRFERGMEAVLDRGDRRLLRRAAMGARAPLGRAGRDAGVGRRQLVSVQGREERACAARRSRRDPHDRQRPRRCDARIHRALPARDRGGGHGLQGVRPRVRRCRQPDGVAGRRRSCARSTGIDVTKPRCSSRASCSRSSPRYPA